LKNREFAIAKAIFVFSLFIIPFLASAGIFSAFLYDSEEENDQVFGRLENSQNIHLLQAALNTDPNPAKGGGDITIVDDTALLAETGLAGSLVEVEERKNAGNISIYEVRKGDTLAQIASMFDVSENTIRWANNLEGNITPGQTLVILPISGVKHLVKTGGTVADIAAIYHGDPREIAIFNGISVDTELKPGDQILVPNGEIAEEKKETKKKSVAKKTSGKTTSTTYSGYFMRPISGGTRTQGIHGYNGVDLAAPTGTPVYASAAGVVIISKSAGWNGGYGNYVVIKHDNGTQTLYAHNSSNTVISGQRVNQGEVIGYIGNTGKSTGPHLHFEVRGATNPF
jgi:LysM repeat protein